MSKPYRDELRAAIIRTSMDLGCQSGEKGLTMRAIASKLGISATALYQHFENKSAILKEIRTQGLSELWSSIEFAFSPELEKAGIRAQLVEFGRRYIRFARSYPWLYQVLMETGELKTIQFNPHGQTSQGGAQLSSTEQGGAPQGLGSHAQPSTGKSVEPLEATREAFKRARDLGQLPADFEISRATVQLWAAIHGLTTLLINGSLEARPEPFAVTDTDTFIDEFLERLVDGQLRAAGQGANPGSIS